MKKRKANQVIQLNLPFIKNVKKEILVSLSKEEKIELIQALAELMFEYKENTNFAFNNEYCGIRKKDKMFQFSKWYLPMRVGKSYE
ncbi:MAG: hypothetical protein H6911_06340 [Rickettsiaceae bacterium]|nr:hypothetical protein [Rickettsiaceae bacterium]